MCPLYPSSTVYIGTRLLKGTAIWVRYSFCRALVHSTPSYASFSPDNPTVTARPIAWSPAQPRRPLGVSVLVLGHRLLTEVADRSVVSEPIIGRRLFFCVFVCACVTVIHWWEVRLMCTLRISSVRHLCVKKMRKKRVPLIFVRTARSADVTGRNEFPNQCGGFSSDGRICVGKPFFFKILDPKGLLEETWTFSFSKMLSLVIGRNMNIFIFR